MRPGALVGRGNTSDIFEWGRGAVAKVLRPGIPAAWAETEARTTALVHAAGLPAPEVLDLVRVDGRMAIVFERVVGPSMWDRMLAEPAGAGGLVDLLVDLQSVITGCPAPPGLARLRGRLRDNIVRADILDGHQRTAALATLERLPDGDRLCHFDLHPKNVLLAAVGPVVVDWFDASAGDPTADAVRSAVLMYPQAAAGHLPGAGLDLLDAVHSRYVERALPPELSRLPDWRRAVLAARLAEPLPAAALRATMADLRSVDAVGAPGLRRG